MLRKLFQPESDDSDVLHLQQPLPQFAHKPLDRNLDSIRLLKILPDLTSRGHVRCSIKHAVIQGEIYTALSYQWGAYAGSGSIIIDDKIYHVQSNLLYFLQISRLKSENPFFWIDAICIDQNNVRERNHQVNLMGQIYSNATDVWVWLRPDSQTARFINCFNLSVRKQGPSYENDPALILSQHHAAYWWGLLRTQHNPLYENTYWSRAWITQELALARDLRFLGGDYEVKARRAWWFLNHFKTKNIPVLTTVRHLKAMPSKASIISLHSGLMRQHCKIRRDIVYSLLALSLERPTIRADYESSDEAVMWRILDACKTHGTLCLCAVGITSIALQLHDTPIGSIIIRLEQSYKKSQFRQFCLGCDCIRLCFSRYDPTKERFILHLDERARQVWHIAHARGEDDEYDHIILPFQMLRLYKQHDRKRVPKAQYVILVYGAR